VEKLVEDEAVFAAVDALLFESMTGSEDADHKKRAAVLYADLHLEASGAVEAVKNASALLSQDLDSLSFASAEEVVDFLQELIPQIIPPEALSSGDAFAALLDGFQDAWSGYEAFGSELGADPAVPQAVNLGDVTQKALFSFLVAEALRPGSLYGSEEEARAALWAAAGGEEPAAPLVAGAFEDPFQTGTPLQNILDAAGISF